jgi:hypothetical protein
MYSTIELLQSRAAESRIMHSTTGIGFGELLVAACCMFGCPWMSCNHCNSLMLRAADPVLIKDRIQPRNFVGFRDEDLPLSLWPDGTTGAMAVASW